MVFALAPRIAGPEQERTLTDAEVCTCTWPATWPTSRSRGAATPSPREQAGALSGLVAQSGDCEGMSAADILEAGNCVLSGREDCGVDASVINGCLSDANESHVDGDPSTGFLCEE
jgi:hypothetical protein